MVNGTPKKLSRAIKNGMWIAAKSNRNMVDEIERHVRDFWNQQLSVLMFEGHVEAVRRFQELIDSKEREHELRKIG